MLTKEQMDNWKMTYDDPYEQRRNEVPHSKAASCDPYDGAPVVDDAYKQDFSAKYARRHKEQSSAPGGLNDRGVMSMVREFAEVMNQEPNAFLALDLVYEEYKEFLEADNPKDDLKELADLVYVLYGYANTMGWGLDEAIRRIHKNNLMRCIQADGTVRYREDGKVLKRTDAPKVNLEDLV